MSARLREDQLRALAAAYNAYQDRLEDLTSIEPCHAAWPSDPPGPGYLGTQCQLLDGHDSEALPPEKRTLHRHRMLGSQVVVTW